MDLDQIKSVDALLAYIEEQGDPKYLYFWGHTPAKDGSIGKACFSQWWLAHFEIDGVTYRTSEHYMMACKARLFHDQATLKAILKAKHPREAKELGRKVANFDAAQWSAVAFDRVVEGNYAKFSQNQDLRDFLLHTTGRVIVEASPYDKIWGIGLTADHTDAAHPLTWAGQNLLGFAIMAARGQLRA